MLVEELNENEDSSEATTAANMAAARSATAARFSARVVRRWLENYQKLKEAIEAICEINHALLRLKEKA